ncbi:HK97 family phage prohead protease [Zhenhengia yiwuensis]|uniref:HK97 family phage prohead protease n=1 Tax=Zhenhengia yiwuensis TaxID=2763666 RepID=A0A926IB21_9FIRM|nr:HK97 family phage prohead protease [Zhenhengia yiwuensis]MBC8581480.1 HK97 family phage prohead protease [Zhenhengia yiwuensis]
MKVEIRSATEAIVEGYVNAVERESRLIPSPFGSYTEKVEAGTFQKALNSGKAVELRFNHGRVLGNTTDGTLELREDSIGLYAKATITDPEVITKAQKGELRGWSFGFKDNKPKIQEAKRVLRDIELREVSILDKMPAYIATSIELRGEESDVLEERGAEDHVEVNIKGKQQQAIDYKNYEREIEVLSLGGK